MNHTPHSIDITADNYEAVVIEGSRTVPVLVDFWAEWCQPCKALMPLLSQLAEEYAGKFILAKVDTEQQQEIAAQFGIRSIPTVKLFKNGQPVDEFMGALPEGEVRAFLDKHLPRESDALLAKAKILSLEGDPESAGRILDQAREIDPDNPRVLLAVATLEAEQGEIDKAEQTLNRLGMDDQSSPEAVSLKGRIVFQRIAESASPEIDPGNPSAGKDKDSADIHRLAARNVLQGDFETALDLLFQLMQQDRSYGNDAGRKGMIAVFDIIGGSDPLVSRYRNRMFNALH
ncbi:MAG: thioredoxin [Gammaproteobacteria bacterium]|nr:thioredoxin [Gammaproteobacteria bacterium]